MTLKFKKLLILLSSKRIDYIAWLFSTLFTLGGIALNLNKYWQYDSGHYDFGIFDSAIWKVAHLKLPIIEHLVIPGKLIWADHFHPSIFLLSPIYWFTDKSEAILIAQDIAVGLSGLVLYFMGVKLLKDRFLALSVLISYFLFTGLQNAVLFDFHELTVATLFIMLTYWAIFNDRKRLFFLFFFITLGFKEPLFLFGVGLAIFIFITKKSWRKIAIFTGVFSIVYGLVVLKFVIPFFSGGLYQYGPGEYKSTIELISRFFTPFIKIKTILLTLLSFLFLPIFAPSLFAIMFFHYSGRFLNPFGERWDLGLHYNAEIAPTLAVASILGLVYLSKKLSKIKIYGIAFFLIVISGVLYRFVLHGPYGLTYHPDFYRHTKNFYFLDEMIEIVPKDTKLSVTAQNNLLVRFSHHDYIELLQPDYYKNKTDYILFDLRSGQNINNLFMTEDQMRQAFDMVKKDPEYILIYENGDQYVFKRKI